MNKIIRKKNENFTIISNVILRDKRISLKAKGVMALVMSLPSDWDFTIKGLISVVKEGRDCVYAAIKELRSFGYCDVVVCRDDRGKLLGNDYVFFEEPLSTKESSKHPYTGFPDTANPDTDFPDTDNPTQIKKENEEKKKETNSLFNNPLNPPKGYESFDLTYVDDDFRDVFFDWLDYKRERRDKKYTDRGLKTCYKKLLKDSNNSPETARLIIDNSIANNWAGFFELKTAYGTTQTTQRAYQGSEHPTDEQMERNAIGLINSLAETRRNGGAEVRKRQ